jgi:predicted O-linked N-acetylglucosamine transferase (SPINDLY family)
MAPLSDAIIEAFFAEAARSVIGHDEVVRQVNYCLEIGRPFEAYRTWRLWCGQYPAEPYGWLNAGATAANAGFHEEAIICALELFKIAPDDRQIMLRALSMSLISSTFASCLDQANITKVSNSYTKRLREDPQLRQIPDFSESGPAAGKRKRRIGYFWNYFDIGAEFCFPFHHNRDRFEVLAVTPSSKSFPAERLGVDRCIEYPDDDLLGAVRAIRAADLDILIDLNGRGDSNYADLILEARAASLQAIYGNFHASTLSPSIDALIGDRAILQIIAAHKHSERLIPLSEACMSVRNPHSGGHHERFNIPARPYRYRIGTPGNHLKLSPQFFKLIANILKKIEDSSFFYCHYSTDEISEYIRYSLFKENIPMDRIEIFSQYEIDYYSMINEIDVAIDSLPYNGHLSTYEHLSQGTPVWSLSGPRMTQRYGHMLIGHVGMSEWVFESQEELIASLAKNIQVKTPEAAARLRQRVSDSSLGDPARATRLMEDAIETLISQPR